MSPPVTAQQLGELIRPLECKCEGSTLRLTYHPDGHLDLDCDLCKAHEETDAGFLCLGAEEAGIEFAPTRSAGAEAMHRGEPTAVILPPVEAAHSDLPDAHGPSWSLIVDLLLLIALAVLVGIALTWRLL